MPKLPPRNRGSAELHHRLFAQFCKWEIASGGPDPHMEMASYLALRTKDPLWAVGCYTAPYTVATQVAVTDRWGRLDVLRRPMEFTAWVNRHWDYLPIRKERRVNGVGPNKLAEIMISYAGWLEEGGLDRLLRLPFHEAFKALDPPHHGRYFRIKMYEVLRRTLIGMKHVTRLPAIADIVPKGGAHTRRGLQLMYPVHNPKSNKPADLIEANAMAGELIDNLGRQGTMLNWLTVEVLLCNYRQAAKGSQYPGRAHDSELGHYKVARRRFIGVDKILACRRSLYDPRCLGEVDGKWLGRRLELGKVMNDYGYVWSDMVYDYVATKDLANPVRWPCT